MSHNANFFDKKKEWSKTKDRILGYYLVPYFQKMMSFSANLTYVDCFAGKGRFGDGEIGSPLIALDVLDKTSNNSRYSFVVKPIFIEKRYADELNNAIKESSYRYKNDVVVIKDKFENCIHDVLNSHLYSSLFLYVDPYGIKELDVGMFNSFSKINGAKTEILINFNTWGFIREACRIMSYEFTMDEDIDEYLLQMESTKIESIDELNRIAGGDFWQRILLEYHKHKIDAYEAEERLSKGIANAFSGYKYVLNIPIKSSNTSKIPKYRLYHLTNHCGGCTLMADTMYKAFSEASIKYNSGQQSLFDLDFQGGIVDEDKIRHEIVALLTDEYVRLEEFKASFYINAGICCSLSSLGSILRKMEDEGLIYIRREPAMTKNGKISKFINEKANQKAYIKLI